MVLRSFIWPHGGRQVFLSGSFTGWTRHYQMTLVEGSLTVFHVWVDLPEGYHEYRFLVDGIWLYDNLQDIAADGNGTLNNVIYIRPPEVAPPILQEPYTFRSMGVDDGITLHTASSSSHMPSEPVLHISNVDVEATRRWVSELLSSRTAYDMLPVSSKVPVIDADLPVKQAFSIMYEEGLAIVPLWDNHRETVTGMLTASDFILILRQLQNSRQMIADGELEMHTVAAWKEGRPRPRTNGPVGMHIRPLMHVSDHECLKDMALRILQNEISAIPVFRSSSQGEPCMQLLNLGCLPGILKYICRHFREPIWSMPLLQQPIYRIPLGTWLPETGRGSQRQLATLPHQAPLSSALGLLLEARISSIPVVDDSGALLDVYSRSDIMALAKDDAYAHIQLDQMTMDQALNQVYQANPLNNGRRRCNTCSRTSSLCDVMERLSDPAVRRLVIIDPRTRRVEGIVSLRDVFRFLLGP